MTDTLSLIPQLYDLSIKVIHHNTTIIFLDTPSKGDIIMSTSTPNSLTKINIGVVREGVRNFAVLEAPEAIRRHPRVQSIMSIPVNTISYNSEEVRAEALERLADKIEKYQLALAAHEAGEEVPEVIGEDWLGLTLRHSQGAWEVLKAILDSRTTPAALPVTLPEDLDLGDKDAVITFVARLVESDGPLIGRMWADHSTLTVAEREDAWVNCNPNIYTSVSKWAQEYRESAAKERRYREEHAKRVAAREEGKAKNKAPKASKPKGRASSRPPALSAASSV